MLQMNHLQFFSHRGRHPFSECFEQFFLRSFECPSTMSLFSWVIIITQTSVPLMTVTHRCSLCKRDDLRDLRLSFSMWFSGPSLS